MPKTEMAQDKWHFSWFLSHLDLNLTISLLFMTIAVCFLFCLYTLVSYITNNMITNQGSV